MNKKSVLISAVPRSGNTFLSRCFSSALSLNWGANVRLSSHIHCPAILSFDQTEDIKIYTLFRDPLENIISSTAHKIFYQKGPTYVFNNDYSVVNFNINEAINQYTEYLEFQKDNKKATVIMFDKLIKDPNDVINKMFEDCEMIYENQISVDDVLLAIKREDENLYTDGAGDFANAQRHTPHGIETNPIYNILKRDLPLMPVYQKLESLYNETLDELRKSSCKIYE